jgi:hypothetical protein
MSLKSELESFRNEFMTSVPAEIRDTMTGAHLELGASGITERALKAGDRVADFSAPDATGKTVRLLDPWRRP